MQFFRRTAVSASASLTMLGTALLLGACSTPAPTSAPPMAGASAPAPAAQAAKGVPAIARLQPTQASTVSGTIRFTPQADGSVRVQGTVQGLAPNAEHGFHIHEKGDCSSGDGLSAGGHFNPTQQVHGKFDATAHHAGDLPSLRSDGQGMAGVDFVSRSFSLTREANGILGRGLIVHKDPDDYTTQPTGNSGARLACAAIERGA